MAGEGVTLCNHPHQTVASANTAAKRGAREAHDSQGVLNRSATAGFVENGPETVAVEVDLPKLVAEPRLAGKHIAGQRQHILVVGHVPARPDRGNWDMKKRGRGRGKG